jgi:arsenite-transporting ATPase
LTGSLQRLITGEGAGQRLIFVGGKGGVGKTTTSSAIAVRCADAGLRTLIVSTDPAHSLGDALMQDLSGGEAVDIVGCENLSAMEVDTEDAVARFRDAVGGFRAADLGLGGIAEDVIGQLGLDAFADVLDNTPPGLDELLALAEVLALVRTDADDLSATDRYDRVIFDTAPTGHTLRLLAFPDFINNLLDKLIQLKSRVQGALSLLTGMLGPMGNPAAKLEAAVRRLEEVRARILNLRALLTNEETTDFVVVSVPTRLAVAESARLLSTLVEQDVPVHHLVVNQLVTADMTPTYVDKIHNEQQRALRDLDSGKSPLAQLSVSRVPFLEAEVRGVYPLKYFGALAFGGANGVAWQELLDSPRERFVLVGGKGGVGKSTTSASLAVTCAERGSDTLIVSTDPAHSLGDALQVDLSDGKPRRVEGVAGGSLWAVEVKVDDAVKEFKSLLTGLADGQSARPGGQIGIADFANVLDAVPPGVDELVALAKVVGLARRNELGVRFDRVIIDTAPTGHTLRLLSFPQFLDRFIERLLALRAKFDSATAAVGMATNLLGNLFSGGGNDRAKGHAGDGDGSPPSAVGALKDFQLQMRELEALLHDEATSEFVIVSIPTALSLIESERLQAALKTEGVAVRRAVLNRLLDEGQQQAFIDRLARGQAECLAELNELGRRSDVSITPVPFFDVEVRAVYGLRAMGNALFAPEREPSLTLP